MVHNNWLCFHIDRLEKYTFRWETVLLTGHRLVARLRRAAFSFAGAEMMTVSVELVVGSPERPVGWGSHCRDRARRTRSILRPAPPKTAG